MRRPPRSGTGSGAGGPRRARPDGNRRARLVVLASLLALASAYAGIQLWRRTTQPRAPAAANAPADPATLMSPLEAAGVAARLYREGRASESLPYYRRVAPQIAPGRLDFRLEFATALQRASLQSDIGSRERVRLMFESLEELELTERAVTRPRDRARVMLARAFFLGVWGFSADAAAELRRASATDPSYPDLPALTRLMERSLREPTLPVEALKGPGLRY